MPDQLPPNSIAARALELASGDNAVIRLHLDDCRLRYIDTQKSIEALAIRIEALSALMWRGLGFLVLLLLTIIGFLVTKSVTFGVHP